jgi:hypothetical protein
MSAQTVLSGGDKYFSYSGVLFGDVSVPAAIQMIFIPNTGLRDSLVYLQPYYGLVVSSTTGAQLGIEVRLDDTTIYKAQSGRSTDVNQVDNNIQLFVPRQSKLEIFSLNTSGNNTQERGVNLLGYYL